MLETEFNEFNQHKNGWTILLLQQLITLLIASLTKQINKTFGDDVKQLNVNRLNQVKYANNSSIPKANSNQIH